MTLQQIVLSFIWIYALVGFFFWLAVPAWEKATAVSLIQNEQERLGQQVEARFALHLNLLAHYVFRWPTFLFPEKQ